MIEDSGLGNHRIKLPAGSAAAYPATSLHRVAPLTRGVRLACVLWIQSQIRDPAQRRILVDLDVAAGHMRQRAADAPELKLVSAAYHNLLRLWAEVEQVIRPREVFEQLPIFSPVSLIHDLPAFTQL